jgi:hypothetical protein
MPSRLAGRADAAAGAGEIVVVLGHAAGGSAAIPGARVTVNHVYKDGRATSLLWRRGIRQRGRGHPHPQRRSPRPACLGWSSNVGGSHAPIVTPRFAGQAAVPSPSMAPCSPSCARSKKPAHCAVTQRHAGSSGSTLPRSAQRRRQHGRIMRPPWQPTSEGSGCLIEPTNNRLGFWKRCTILTDGDIICRSAYAFAANCSDTKARYGIA